jgi:hypothetical protein
MKRLMLVIGLAVAASAILVPSFAQAAEPAKKLDVMLYVDTVNGSRPAAGVARRKVSCTQTNVFTRGEQQVFRVWGTVAGSGDILSTENVKYAYVTVPGSPNLKMNWGSHGSVTNKVWFWTAAWNLPADAPLGDATAKIVFKTEGDTFGTYEFKYTVVPQLTVTAAKKVTVKKNVTTVKARS